MKKTKLEHSGPEVFADELKMVWKNVGTICMPGARLVVRFGGIRDRKAEALPILKGSFSKSGWRIQTRKSAGFASNGRRQAMHINKTNKAPLEEHDLVLQDLPWE